MSIDHTSPTDLSGLASRVRALDARRQVILAGAAASAGLMRLPAKFRIPVVLISKIHRKNLDAKMDQFWSEVYKRDPVPMMALVDETLTHMTHGRDMSDPRSAGGWNRDELNTFLKLAAKRGIDLDPPALDSELDDPDRHRPYGLVP